MDRMVNNIWFEQNLTCMLRTKRTYNLTVKFNFKIYNHVNFLVGVCNWILPFHILSPVKYTPYNNHSISTHLFFLSHLLNQIIKNHNHLLIDCNGLHCQLRRQVSLTNQAIKKDSHLQKVKTLETRKTKEWAYKNFIVWSLNTITRLSPLDILDNCPKFYTQFFFLPFPSICASK